MANTPAHMSTDGNSNDDPLVELDDVMAFIDGFFPSPSDDAFERSLLLGGSSSEDSENDPSFSSLFGTTTAPLPSLFASAFDPLPFAVATDAARDPSDQDITLSITPTTTTAAVCSTPQSSIESTQSISVATASPLPTNEPPIKDATRKRNAYRDKMKREMQYLRSRASEMEQQLAALRQGTVALSTADKQLIDSSWQRIAQHQLEARRVSEAENARLKRVVQTHVAMSKSLEQTLGKRLDAAFLADDERQRTSKIKRGRTTTKQWEDDGFKDLLGELDATYERLDDVLHASGVLELTGASLRQCHVRTDAPTPFVELTDASVAPFHPRLTARAVWRSMMHQFFTQGTSASSPTNTFYHSGNTIAAKSRTLHRLADQGGHEQFVNATFVVRKYVDEDSRMVVVWRAHNECESRTSGTFVDETGWSVVQPIAATPCGFPDTGSVVRTCIQFTERHRRPNAADATTTTSVVMDSNAAADAMVEQQTPSSSSSVGGLTDLVMSISNNDLSVLAKAVENILLDEATAQINTKSSTSDFASALQ